MRASGATAGIRNGHANGAAAPAALRCAIYCRKSVEERQATDFGSIEAQREACEAFVKSQASLGWTALAHRYDDEGFTGANVDRPAVTRLLTDVEAGNVDVVVVYKIDRLSRSIADFVRLTELFDRHGVAFVSVTQQFNTATSVGRLTLNLLTVFAQFERETISERTRDKMRAARRRGKFTGGSIILGYDRHPEGRRLVVNEAEAVRVREIFDLYLKERSLVSLARVLNERGWTTKAWTTRKGNVRPGNRFTALHLRNVLRNPAYVGKVRLDGQSYDAEYPGIVDPTIFSEVHALIARNAQTGGRDSRNTRHALLTGLIRCVPCDAPMLPTYTKRPGRLYAYYACRTTRRVGWAACPTKSVPASEIERLVVEQIRAVGKDPAVQAATLEAARAQPGGQEIDANDLRRALSLWDQVWAALMPKEQARVTALLVEAVGYDGAAGTVALTFRPTGIQALSAEVGT